MHRDGSHSRKITCASCPPRQASAPVPDGSWIYDHDHKPETQPAPWETGEIQPFGWHPPLISAGQWRDQFSADGRTMVTVPAWQAMAEQSRRDQAARDQAAQDRFYAGPMAGQYRG